MQQFFFTIVYLALANLAIGQQKLLPIWQIDSNIIAAKDALYDAVEKRIYVTYGGNDPYTKDKNAGIALVSTDGKLIYPTWVNGLHSPRGMAITEFILFVVDQNEIAIIDVRKSNILQRVKIEGATALTDIAIGAEGIIYVTDTRMGRVYKMEKEKSSIIMEGLKNLCGIKAVGSNLFVVAAGGVLKIDAKKELTRLVSGLPTDAYGIEVVSKNEFVVACRSGALYYIKDQQSIELQPTISSGQGIVLGDISYDAKRKIIYVTDNSANGLKAYQLLNK